MNKKFARILAFLMVLCICVCCAACGEQPSNDKGKPQNSISTPVVDDTSSTESQGNSSNNSQNSSANNSSNNSSQPTVSDSDRLYYKPTSVTLSMYDTTALSVGFTWNSEFEPIDPVIQICEGSTFSKSKCKEYKATYKTEMVNMPSATYIYV